MGATIFQFWKLDLNIYVMVTMWNKYNVVILSKTCLPNIQVKINTIALLNIVVL